MTTLYTYGADGHYTGCIVIADSASEYYIAQGGHTTIAPPSTDLLSVGEAWVFSNEVWHATPIVAPEIPSIAVSAPSVYQTSAVVSESAAQISARYERIVQAYLDDTAQAAGYDDIRSAVTYADEPMIQKFQIEGRAFRAWRSLVWARCYELQKQIENGERELPKPTDFLLFLPELSL